LHFSATLGDRDRDRFCMHVQPNESCILGHDRLLSPCGSAFLASQLGA
jgi:hypothetical protein